MLNEHYQDLMQELAAWRTQDHHAASFTHNPHIERLIEATAVLAAQCQSLLQRNEASLCFRFYQACFPHLLATTPLGMIVQVQGDNPFTVAEQTKIVLTENHTVCFTSYDTHDFQPIHIKTFSVTKNLALTTLRIEFDSYHASDNLSFYLSDPECVQQFYYLYQTGQLSISINDRAGKLRLNPFTWLPSTTWGLSTSLLQLRELASFPEKFYCFKITFAQTKVSSLTISGPFNCELRQDEISFNCLPIINLMSGQSIPMPARRETRLTLSPKHAQFIALQSVALVSHQDYQPVNLSPKDYYLLSSQDKLFLRLLIPTCAQTLTCQVSYCYSPAWMHTQPLTNLSFQERTPGRLTVKSISNFNPPSHTNVEQYVSSYLKLLHKQLDLHCLQQLLQSLGLPQNTIESLCDYHVEFSQYLSQGVIKHYREHHIHINNDAPAYRYSLFGFCLAQLLMCDGNTRVQVHFKQGKSLLYA